MPALNSKVQNLRLNKIEIGQFFNMKYKLMPEKNEKDNINEDIKSKFVFDRNSSATIKAIAKPDIAASGNEYGICFLLISTPSLFANVSFLMKVVFEKYLTIIGTPTIVLQKKNEDQYEKVFCLLFISEITKPAAKPKLIPNQNTKFHSLSLFSHLGCFVFKLLKVAFCFVKSCIIRSLFRFKPYNNIIPTIALNTKQYIASVIFTTVLLLNHDVYATEINEPNSQANILKIIRKAEKQYGVPKGLLRALIQTESGLKPFALNINGKPHYCNSQAEAVALANQAINSGITNIDIGLSQVNYRWHGSKFDSVESMLCASKNVFYAADLLRSLKLQHGDWHKALRHYHSAKPTYHNEYSRKVVMCWLGIPQTKISNYKGTQYVK